MKRKETAVIVRQVSLGGGICDMTLQAPLTAGDAMPGQFVDLFVNDAGKLLPRPISLCGIDREAGYLRLVYRMQGEGTRLLAGMKAGEKLELLGPLGNGFPLSEAAGKTVYLIGGGIGIPPMLETAKALFEKQKTSAEDAPARIVSVLGYRDDTFLLDEFKQYGDVIIATEDGSCGTKGNVLDAIAADGAFPELCFACGPKPMLRALKNWAADRQIPCWISMEERMACGIGACLACVCKTADKDPHSQVNNTRVCADGPVFPAEYLDLE